MLQPASLSFATRVAGWAILAIGIVTSARGLYSIASQNSLVPDFTVFWTAARVAIDHVPGLYDAQGFTALQKPLVKSVTALRPFVHPPSALPLLAPFGLLSFPAAFALWTILSALAFIVAGRTFGFSRPALLVAIASPPAVLTLLAGQTALLTAAAMMAAIRMLETRPRLAGLILALGAGLKPQVFVAVPIALIAARNWSALASAAIGCVALMAASLIFGVERWSEWLTAVQKFPALISSLGIDSYSITTLSLAGDLGIDGTARSIFAGLCMAAGAALAWWGFRSPDQDRRMIALVTSALVMTPYAMLYELTALAPFAAAWLLRAKLADLLAGLSYCGLGGGLAPLALLGAFVFRNRRAQ